MLRDSSVKGLICILCEMPLELITAFFSAMGYFIYVSLIDGENTAYIRPDFVVNKT
jgi:hypothetical protein